jgi:hypothetical protein|tara:strand:+ start:151 stop:882 length:732 start_codon:yes stop_codon:yes gene_type:complete
MTTISRKPFDPSPRTIVTPTTGDSKKHILYDVQDVDDSTSDLVFFGNTPDPSATKQNYRKQPIGNEGDYVRVTELGIIPEARYIGVTTTGIGSPTVADVRARAVAIVNSLMSSATLEYGATDKACFAGEQRIDNFNAYRAEIRDVSATGALIEIIPTGLIRLAEPLVLAPNQHLKLELSMKSTTALAAANLDVTGVMGGKLRLKAEIGAWVYKEAAREQIRKAIDAYTVKSVAGVVTGAADVA